MLLCGGERVWLRELRGDSIMERTSIEARGGCKFGSSDLRLEDIVEAQVAAVASIRMFN